MRLGIVLRGSYVHISKISYRDSSLSCTSKTKYQNFETNIPKKGILGPQSQFPHSCVCEPFIYFHDRSGLPILLEEICRPILGLNKSLTDTWMLKLGLRPCYSQKRNTYVGFSLQCGFLLVPFFLGSKKRIFGLFHTVPIFTEIGQDLAHSSQ